MADSTTTRSGTPTPVRVWSCRVRACCRCLWLRKRGRSEGVTLLGAQPEVVATSLPNLSRAYAGNPIFAFSLATRASPEGHSTTNCWKSEAARPMHFNRAWSFGHGKWTSIGNRDGLKASSWALIAFNFHRTNTQTLEQMQILTVIRPYKSVKHTMRFNHLTPSQESSTREGSSKNAAGTSKADPPIPITELIAHKSHFTTQPPIEATRSPFQDTFVFA